MKLALKTSDQEKANTALQNLINKNTLTDDERRLKQEAQIQWGTAIAAKTAQMVLNSFKKLQYVKHVHKPLHTCMHARLRISSISILYGIFHMS